MKTIAAVLVLATLLACGGDNKTNAGAAGSAGSSGRSGGATAVSGSSADFCSKIATYDAQFKDAQPSVDDIIRVYTDLAASAPDEIKADLQTLLAYASTRSFDSSASGGDESSQAAALAAAETASNNMTAFVKTSCGIDLDSNSSSAQSKFSAVGSSISN